MAEAIEIGLAPEGVQGLALKRANRHGLIAGATGTGKTVTLQVLAEAFAREGVNVFAADIKGDLSGIATAGDPPPAWAVARAGEINVTLAPEAAPAMFWDVYGELGHPVRTTVTEMGPVLMGRVLEATEAQEGALTIAFRLADDWINEGKNEGLLLDLNDLRSLLTYLSDNADEVGKKYGLVTPQSIAALQRRLLQLEWRAPTASSASRPSSWMNCCASGPTAKARSACSHPSAWCKARVSIRHFCSG
jgi:DNA helicase HerA-like ATPase